LGWMESKIASIVYSALLDIIFREFDSNGSIMG